MYKPSEILDKIIEKIAIEKSKEYLSIIRDKCVYLALHDGCDKSKFVCKNKRKRLRKKWYFSLARKVQNQINAISKSQKNI